MSKPHVETDEQYAKRIAMKKNYDEDNDLLICELQHEIEGLKAEINGLVMEVKYGDETICCLQKRVDDLWEIVSHIDQDSNPAYLYKMRLEYEENCKEGKYNA